MTGRARERLRKLSTAIEFVEGQEPPKEFRIFRRGLNSSTNGPPVLFDARAAELVMGAYREHGVACAIDLEHLSLEDPRTSNNYDPDARGSFGLEVRNGELWAVNVSWTKDALERLASKTQRFFSPAFLTEEPETGKGPERVACLVNVALCAQPALDHLPPLVAATRGSGRSNVTRFSEGAVVEENLSAIAEAFGLPPDSAVSDVLAAASAWVKEMEDAVQGQQPPAAGGDNPTDADGGDGLDGDPAAMRMALARGFVEKFGAIAKLVAKHKPNEKALVAFRSAVMRETNATTTEEATNTIGEWRKSHRDLAAERSRIAREREELEATDRHNLVVELVKLRAFTPAQAWAKDAEGIPQGPDDKKGARGTFSAFVKKFTLAELRELRDDSKKTGGTREPEPPAGGGESGGTTVEVTVGHGKNARAAHVDLSAERAKKLRADFKARNKREPNDSELADSMKRYATLVANTDARSGKKAG